jgi:uncharacterized membrane-anchored protein
MIRKVPEITALFWAVKLLTTAMGEATSDFLVVRINPFLAVALAGVALATALVLQFRLQRYNAFIYWLTAVMVAIFGTMAADGLHVQLGVPYIISTILCAALLAAVFIVWYKTEGNLSIHSITNRRREAYYWATVMATFSLGTAVGDLSATTLGLGFFASGLLFIGLIAIPAIAFWCFGLSSVTAFWTAYILTRPLGASFADWFSKSTSRGGLGWGDGHVSLILSILIIMLVGSTTLNSHKYRLFIK